MGIQRREVKQRYAVYDEASQMLWGQTITQPHRQIKCLLVVHRFKCSLHAHQDTILAGEPLLLSDKLLEAVFTHENAQGDSLMRKIENLIKSDRIPPLFAEMAHLARKIGNLGAHFADETVTAEDVEVVPGFVEAILEYIYVIPAKVETVRNRLSKLPNL